ncbi:unnamed protein product [Trichobilharzia szidati]|nr:unnamed protein product [Trichobilharzia szidati]
MVGEPQALYDYLILLAAFISYCHERGLLKFPISSFESHSFDSIALSPNDPKLNSQPKEYLEFKLSITPELPRHSVTYCAPTTLSSSSFHQSNRCIEQSTPLKRTPASFQVKNSSFYPGDNNNHVDDDHLTSLLHKSNLFPRIQSDNNIMKTNYHPSMIQSCHPSRLEMHIDSSPPATPNAMNAYLEIAPSNSPDAVAPSLKNSPNIQQQIIPNCQVANKFEAVRESTSPLIYSSKKEIFGSKESVVSMDSVSMNALMTSPYLQSSSPRQHGIRLSPPSSNKKRTNYNITNKNINSSITNNNRNTPFTDKLRHKQQPPSSVSDKHDSTSSGRGYSLTGGTQTVPCQSNQASIRSSLLELHTYPDSPNTCAVVTDSPKHHHHHQPRKPYSKDNIMNGSNSSTSCDSIGTSSILAWDEDGAEDHERRRRHSKKRKGDRRQRQLDGSLDELTSILSASLSMDDDNDDGADADNKTPATSRLPSDGTNGDWPPTTSELITETNIFAHALEKRLEYLKSVYVRAHSEAEALASLAQLITSKSLTTIHRMNEVKVDCHICNGNNANTNNQKTTTELQKSQLNSIYERHLHLESLLVQAIDRIDMLLKSTSPAASAPSPTPSNETNLNPSSLNGQLKSINYPNPKLLSLSSSTNNKLLRWDNRSTALKNTDSSLYEYNSCSKETKHHLLSDNLDLTELMNLKHEYMMRAFNLCLDELHTRAEP